MNSKEKAARSAYEKIESRFHKDFILGIGTGSTTNYFIEILKEENPEMKCFVSSSIASSNLLKDAGYDDAELNDVGGPDVYVDGADEVNTKFEAIKGGGGALTKEKIIASASKKFICIVDDSKIVKKFGNFPVAVEVIPMARSYVSRQIVAMGCRPTYRIGFVTDNGNQIIDVLNLNFDVPYETEMKLNKIPGVVENGIFSARKADVVIVSDGERTYELE